MESRWSSKKLILFWSVLIAVIIGAIYFPTCSDDEVGQELPIKEIPESLEITEEDIQELFWPEGTPEEYISGYFVGYDIGKRDGYDDGYKDVYVESDVNNGHESSHDAATSAASYLRA